jgi:hypothetical protein
MGGGYGVDGRERDTGLGRMGHKALFVMGGIHTCSCSAGLIGPRRRRFSWARCRCRCRLALAVASSGWLHNQLKASLTLLYRVTM